jgi:GT2 family glycosyltransferase
MSADNLKPLENVWVLVLGYGKPEDTLECIRSIMGTWKGPLRLVFMDNGSSRDDANRVRQAFPQISMIRYEKNDGVGRGFNGGWRWLLQQGADWIVNVCNDTLFTPGAYEAMAREAEAHPRTGMVVPKVVYHHAPDRIWSAGSRLRAFPPAIVHRKTSGPERGEFDCPEALRYAPMCVNLISGEALRTAGLFNAQYRYYYEDVDLCLRMQRHGFGIRYAPDSKILHKSPEIGATARKPDFWRVYGRSASLFQRNLGSDEPALSGPLSRMYLQARAGYEGGLTGWNHFSRGWREGQAEPLIPAPAWNAPGLEEPLVEQVGPALDMTRDPANV